MTSFKRLLFVFVFSMLIVGCSASTEDLAKDVQTSIKEKFKGEGIEIKSFMLTHKGGNEYKGILETKEPGGEFTYSVDVIYDGSAFSWDIVK